MLTYAPTLGVTPRLSLIFSCTSNLANLRQQRLEAVIDPEADSLHHENSTFMMSFGFSVGDFLAVADLIDQTRRRFKGAPREYAALAAEYGKSDRMQTTY